MKHRNITFAISALLLASLACGLGSAPPSPVPEPDQAGRCGDGVCEGPENADLCPADCAEAAGETPAPDTRPTETPLPEATPTETPQPGTVGTIVGARLTLDFVMSYEGDCNVDGHTAEMEFTIFPAIGGGLTGGGEGTLNAPEGQAESIARCAGTFYGGHRTPDPYPVFVSGSAEAGGWRVSLVAADYSYNFFTSGEDYAEGSTLEAVLPLYEGQGGTLVDFTLPQDVQAGDRFTFEVGTSVPDGVGGMTDITGTGTLEILDVQTNAPLPTPTPTPTPGA